MKIEIENLKAHMTGRKLTLMQKADALIEFNKLIDYINELEGDKLHYDSLMGCGNKILDGLDSNEVPHLSLAGLRILLNR